MMKQLNKFELDKKWKKQDLIAKLLNILFLFIYIWIWIYFIYNVYLYSINNKYEDETVTIKEMSLWYNVYNKNWTLKEVNFFDGAIKNGDNKNDLLLSYINNSILFWNWEDIEKSKILILKEPTNILSKTELNKIDNIYIKKIYKTDTDNYVILYIEYNKWEYNYCLTKNTLNLNDPKDKICLKKDNKKLDYSLVMYKWYYIIWLDNMIYFLNQNTKNINLVIDTNWKILDISKNWNNDIKVITNKWIKVIINTYIEYLLIKQIDKKINININDLL